MMVWIIEPLYFVNESGLQKLKHGHVYEVPDNWGRLIVKDQGGAEYVKM